MIKSTLYRFTFALFIYIIYIYIYYIYIYINIYIYIYIYAKIDSLNAHPYIRIPVQNKYVRYNIWIENT